ncbi:hypothetical protein I4U23_010701 [Adineta vaga]|nr:hypothetical protein I4U23_010701 [Adineta vaga]
MNKLPAELIYRILDYLDDLTIVLSCRNVCLQLNSIINSYNRYQTLKTFHLTPNKISLKNIKHLENILQENHILTKLKIDHIEINEKNFFNVLLNNKVLTTLILKDNYITIHGAMHLINDLRDNNTLMKLDLSNNRIVTDGNERFIDFFEMNRNIEIVF